MKVLIISGTRFVGLKVAKLNPYNLNKSLCISTNKISERDSLQSMLEVEFLAWQAIKK